MQDLTLTASRAVVTDSNKKLTSSGATDAEVGHLSGVTSAIQTQLNTKWPAGMTKSITLENPVAGDIFHIFTTQQALTVSRLEAFLVGSSSPSVTWKVHYGPDPSAAGTVVVTAGTTTTVTASIQATTSFNNTTPQVGDAVWLEITAQSGTVGKIHLTIFF